MLSVSISSPSNLCSCWVPEFGAQRKGKRHDFFHLALGADTDQRIAGCSEPPAIQKKTIGKMGLKGTPGLRFAPPDADRGAGQGRGGGGQRPSSGGGGRGGGQSQSQGGQFGGAGGQQEGQNGGHRQEQYGQSGGRGQGGQRGGFQGGRGQGRGGFTA